MYYDRQSPITEDMIDDTKEAIEEVIDRGKQLMANPTDDEKASYGRRV